ncbi:MAG: iron-only hydrogenase system regulator [Butyricicoccus pullicaecorum]|nr:iron-only hydrogenase system regulator [Butyricicoccus pullicaecorum]MDO4668932.1 iron-only hydrogenase system regulator [Butyricicoccus pullicaecorum]
MDTRIAVMSIIVENPEIVESLNSLLHTYSDYIIGRMGIPYRTKTRKINIISLALDAPQDTISSLAGKVGKLSGISVKTALSNVVNYDA